MSYLVALIFCLSMVFSVAWVTMLERKLLSYQQGRVGPNKPGFLGLITPLSDAAKLLTKSWTGGSFLNSIFFKLSPLMFFITYLFMTGFYKLSLDSWEVLFSGLFFFLVAGFSVYGVLLTGWASNSAYALLGALRGGAQALSYEVGLFIFIMMVLFMFSSGYSTLSLFCVSNILPVLLVMFFFVILADLGRAPFDFIEGESELVSGFNVEYSSTPFALIFLGEYLGIVFFSWVYASLWGLSWGAPAVMALFITVRGAYPRARYDSLMMLSWAIILPLMIAGLFLFLV